MDPAQYPSTQFGEIRRTLGPHGYYAYFPAPLPKEVELSASGVLQLADAEAALGRLAGAGRLLPNPHLLVRPYLSREAVASTRIEGTRASLGELFEYDAVGGSLTPDLEEVVNYIRAMELGLELLENLPISTRLMCEMHGVLLDGVRGRERTPGELRRSQNWIGEPGASLERATFVPPPPEELGPLLADWERYANDALPVPLLIRAGLLHYQFETIHPFLDGNGRLGRLLIVFFLVANGRLPSPILYLSPYFEARTDDYYGHLQRVREHGALEDWLVFFLHGIEEQANDAVGRAERLVDLREQYRHRVASVTRSQALSVVDVAFDTPVLTSRLVQQRITVSRPTALSLLRQLADLEILVEERPGPRGQRRWIATEIMQVIAG